MYQPDNLAHANSRLVAQRIQGSNTLPGEYV